MRVYNLIFLILISACLISYNRPLFYDTRKKPILTINSSFSGFLNTTTSLLIERSNKITLAYEIRYRKITMV